MVVAKSRLKKVPNVRKMLHKPTGSFSQRFQSAKASVGKKVKQTLSQVQGAFKKPIKEPMIPRGAIDSVKKMQTQSNAVKNVMTLQASVPPKKMKTPPQITSPSPVSQMKGPTRPPPAPPSNIPSRPITNTPKIAPKVPSKPFNLKGKKMR